MTRLIIQTILLGAIVLGLVVVLHRSALGTDAAYAHLGQRIEDQVTGWAEAMRSQAPEDPEKFHVLVAGDVMLDRGVESRIFSAGDGDWGFPFMRIQEVLHQADIVFVNLEGVLSDNGIDSGKKYSFRVPSAVAPALVNAGIDVVSLANNHTLDWGYDALCDTYQNVQAVGLVSAGAGCDEQSATAPATVYLSDETRIDFLAFTEFYQGAEATGDRPGFAHFDIDNMRAQIANSRDGGADIIMVSLHWGIEYKERSNTDQQVLARELLSAGADVIIGHHPHVPQEIERTEEGWVIYSLGNFVFDQDWSEPTMQGLLADIVIQGGEIITINPYTVMLNENYQPVMIKDIEFDK